eukprot:6210902-Pleurochrysis_carterae.AAC.1
MQPCFDSSKGALAVHPISPLVSRSCSSVTSCLITSWVAQRCLVTSAICGLPFVSSRCDSRRWKQRQRTAGRTFHPPNEPFKDLTSLVSSFLRRPLLCPESFCLVKSHSLLPQHTLAPAAVDTRHSAGDVSSRGRRNWPRAPKYAPKRHERSSNCSSRGNSKAQGDEVKREDVGKARESESTGRDVDKDDARAEEVHARVRGAQEVHTAGSSSSGKAKVTQAQLPCSFHLHNDNPGCLAHRVFIYAFELPLCRKQGVTAVSCGR